MDGWPWDAEADEPERRPCEGGAEVSLMVIVDYAIYRKKAGRWRVIYQGGGSGV